MFILRARQHATMSRSLVKTVTWRMIASIDTFVLSWLITGSIAWAGSIAGLEVITKMLLYYGHERVWTRIDWGVTDTAPTAPTPPPNPDR